MSALSHSFPLVQKEVRALFPIWAACAIALAAGLVSKHYLVLSAGGLALAFGFVTLGAQAFGHEYSHRTLAVLLAQPADRRRIFLIKYGVLAVLASLIVAIAWRAGIALHGTRGNWLQPELILLATASAVFLAPWLSIVCRSALAGAVFAVAIPGLLATAGDVVGTMLYGLDRAADVDRFKYLFLWRVMIVTCLVAAAASWRTFMRLEAVDGPGADLQLPQALGFEQASAVPDRRHPIRLLLGKEIRLQQLTLIVVPLYVLGWLTLTWLERSDPTSRFVPVEDLGVLYAALVSMLIGSMGSAEERQYGTLESQILLPVPAWQQWAVKAGVVLGLALLLGAVLPAALLYVSPAGRVQAIPPGTWLASTLPLAAISLYVSSFSASGVRALMTTLPVLPGLIIYFRTIEWGLHWVRTRLLGRGALGLMRFDGWLVMTLLAGLVPLLLFLALRNHRSLDRSSRTLAIQAGWILGYLTLFAALLAI